MHCCRDADDLLFCELARDVHARYAHKTTSTTSPASGRYMRRSAPTSVAIGTKLDVGDSVMKHHAPEEADVRTPGEQDSTSNAMANDCEQRKPDVSQRHWLRNAVVEDEISRPERLAQIDEQHGRLIQQVRPRAHVGVEARRSRRAGHHEDRRAAPTSWTRPTYSRRTANLLQHRARRRTPSRRARRSLAP